MTMFSLGAIADVSLTMSRAIVAPLDATIATSIIARFRRESVVTAAGASLGGYGGDYSATGLRRAAFSATPVAVRT